MLLGNMTGRLGSLVDARSEEEKRRDAQRIMDPFGTKKGRAMQEAIGNEAPKQPGYWDGGDKFTGKDALKALLTIVAETADRQSGRAGGSADALGAQRLSAINMAKKKQAQQAQIQKDAQILMRAGYSPEQAIAMATGNLKPSDVKPDRQMTKTGDIRQFDPITGQSREVYREQSPQLMTTNDAVYAMDRRTGQAFNPGGGTGNGPDAVPTIEDGYQYTPGPGGRANQGNWKPVGGAGPSQAPRGFR